MQQELTKFKQNKVGRLLPSPKDTCILGMKWVFQNKMDKEGNVIYKKACLVITDYYREEGINYEETFAPVTRLECVPIFLAYTANKKF